MPRERDAGRKQRSRDYTYGCRKVYTYWVGWGLWMEVVPEDEDGDDSENDLEEMMHVDEE